jgi:hypothetical protein
MFADQGGIKYLGIVSNDFACDAVALVRWHYRKAGWPASPSSVTSHLADPPAAVPSALHRARRHPRSRGPIFAFTMTDPAVHDGRSSRSRWSEIRSYLRRFQHRADFPTWLYKLCLTQARRHAGRKDSPPRCGGRREGRWTGDFFRSRAHLPLRLVVKLRIAGYRFDWKLNG